MTDLNLAELRRIAEEASHEKQRGIEVGYGIQRLAFQWIDNADPSIVLALLDRIEALEASLARVTTDSTAERIAAAIFDVRDDEFDLDEWGDLDSTDKERYKCDARAALAAIRAVAADEQPKHIHEGDVFQAGECCGAPHCKANPHVEGCYATDPDMRDDRAAAADEQEASHG